MRVSGIIGRQVGLWLALDATAVNLFADDDKVGVSVEFAKPFEFCNEDYAKLKEIANINPVIVLFTSEYIGSGKVDLAYTYPLKEQEEIHEE